MISNKEKKTTIRSLMKRIEPQVRGMNDFNCGITMLAIGHELVRRDKERGADESEVQEQMEWLKELEGLMMTALDVAVMDEVVKGDIVLL